MKTAFLLCFANDEKETLKSLKTEREELLKLLDKGHSKNHFILKEIPNATTKKVINGLMDYQKKLALFFFSGHAGHDKLVFEDKTANAKGIAGLLDKCPKLDLVILNGCSTVGHVQTLAKLSNKPAVIATSAPVDDYSATQFSIAFFKTLVEQEGTLTEAFDIAIAVARMHKKIFLVSNNRELKSDYQELESGYRELVSRDEEDDIWWLFIPPERPELKDWKLPKTKPWPILTLVIMMIAISALFLAIYTNMDYSKTLSRESPGNHLVVDSTETEDTTIQIDPPPTPPVEAPKQFELTVFEVDVLKVELDGKEPPYTYKSETHLSFLTTPGRYRIQIYDYYEALIFDQELDLDSTKTRLSIPSPNQFILR